MWVPDRRVFSGASVCTVSSAPHCKKDLVINNLKISTALAGNGNQRCLKKMLAINNLVL